jgi:hypothetical protein
VRTSSIVLGTHPESGKVCSMTPAAQGFHTAVFGSTGVGKSYLAHTVAVQHVVNRGGGVGVIDPHADLSLGILSYLVAGGFYRRPEAFERVVYLDFSEEAFLPFNVLNQPHQSPHATAEMVLEAMERTFKDLTAGAPLLKTLFLAGAVALIENELPLTCLYPLLLDQDFRERCLQHVRDPLVHQTFGSFDQQRGGTAAQAASTLRRAFLMTFSPVARYTLGQPENVLDLRSIMDSGKTLLLNLGSIPHPRTRRFIGALVMTLLEQAALSRADVPPNKRRPFTAIVDEWPVICARQPETLSSILDTSRKYGLSLWLLGQHAGQIGAARLSGALENCRMVMLFRLGPESAAALAPHVTRIDPYLVKTPAHTHRQRDTYMSASEQRELWRRRLQELPARHLLLRVPGSAPQEIRTLNVEAASPNPAELSEVVAEYRRRYQRSRSEALAAVDAVLERVGGTRGTMAETLHNHETPIDPDTDLDDFDFADVFDARPA